MLVITISTDDLCFCKFHASDCWAFQETTYQFVNTLVMCYKILFMLLHTFDYWACMSYDQDHSH